jgi:hypothetical protein
MAATWRDDSNVCLQEKLQMPKNEGEKKTRKKSERGPKEVLRSVVGSAVATESLIELAERLGLVDLVVGQVRSRIENTDVDELLDDATDYLRRNPEVLVIGLGAVTLATGLMVWLNSRREWDGEERRVYSSAKSESGRARRASAEH